MLSQNIKTLVVVLFQTVMKSDKIILIYSMGGDFWNTLYIIQEIIFKHLYLIYI